MHRIALTLTLSAAIGLVTLAEADAEAVKATPELSVFTSAYNPSGEQRGPIVLRGSATRRGTVDARFGSAYQPPGFQVGAGAKLWLTDPVSGRVVVCDERRTSRVGRRFIGCVEDQLPYPVY